MTSKQKPFFYRAHVAGGIFLMAFFYLAPIVLAAFAPEVYKIVHDKTTLIKIGDYAAITFDQSMIIIGLLWMLSPKILPALFGAIRKRIGGE